MRGLWKVGGPTSSNTAEVVMTINVSEFVLILHNQVHVGYMTRKCWNTRYVCCELHNRATQGGQPSDGAGQSTLQISKGRSHVVPPCAMTELKTASQARWLSSVRRLLGYIYVKQEVTIVAS